ncbi:TIGR00725 family protein [Candidatus Fermentibacteria bacterium]|nr:TIGR00725 family protein [Candidatus Fermentibacteria bacterium]
MFVAVVGGSTCSAEDARVAEAVGRGLASRGATLVCGGMGGVMEAACRGAKAAGGLTVGILPGDDRRSANPHVDVPVVTGMGHARNAIVVKTAQAVIAVDGSYGTLSEIALALQNGIEVIGLGTWDLSLHGQADRSIIPARDAEEAVEKAIAAAGKRRD